MNGYEVVRIKRRWVPEWLWWWACNPIPLWSNEIWPLQLATARPWVWLLTAKGAKDAG